MEQNDFVFIQDQIGYNFQNTDLLQQAFVRRSYAKEHGGEDNEVLEFIGDKVLDLIVIKLLTEKYGCFTSDYEDYNPNDEFEEFSCSKNEAELTELKKRLVQKKTLADRIDVLDLADYLIMGNSDIQNNIHHEMSVKEDLFEAIIGAVALDSNWDMEELQEVVQIMLDPDSYLEDDMEENYVQLIQEWTLKKYGEVPQYYFEEIFPTKSTTLANVSLQNSYNAERRYPARLTTLADIMSQNNDSARQRCPAGLTTLASVMSSNKDTPKSKYACKLRLGEFNKVFKSLGASKNEARKAVCELAYKELERKDLLFSIRDEIPNPNIADAISQLEILARRGYFSIPLYDFIQEYDNNGNPVWQCTCHIKEITKHFFAKSSSKKYAKKQAAYQMLKYTLLQ